MASHFLINAVDLQVEEADGFLYRKYLLRGVIDAVKCKPDAWKEYVYPHNVIFGKNFQQPTLESLFSFLYQTDDNVSEKDVKLKSMITKINSDVVIWYNFSPSRFWGVGSPSPFDNALFYPASNRTSVFYGPSIKLISGMDNTPKVENFLQKLKDGMKELYHHDRIVEVRKNGNYIVGEVC